MKPESFPLLPLILVLSHNVSARPPLDDLGTEPQHRSVRRRAPNDYGYDDSYYYDRNCDYDYYDEYDRGYNPYVLASLSSSVPTGSKGMPVVTR